MNTSANDVLTESGYKVRPKKYMVTLIILMGLVALLDQYISMIKTTAIPFAIEEYGITASEFSWYEALYLATTFGIFILNGLNDIIGRKFSILVLTLMMGLSSLAIVFFTPSFHLFMIFYTLAMFTTVSNMWSIPISEESPADKRAKYVSIVYVIGLIPLQAILPPILQNVLGLSWKWMYGVTFILMLPTLVLWFKMQETQRFAKIQEERRKGERKKHFYGLGVINKQDLRYIAIASSIWLCWLVYSMLYFWAGYYFMTVKGYTLNQWSLTLLATLIMAIIGGLSSGAIMDRFGRKPAFVVGCVSLSLVLLLLGFGKGWLLPAAAIITGYFTSFTYTWIVVYVPEVFPTERRGACMGWTTTVARVSYVVRPILAAILLDVSPTMEWFWVVAAVIVLIPIAIILSVNPYETKTKELEEIEIKR